MKFGSLQAFVDCESSLEDKGSDFLKQFHKDEIHKIAILDLRIFNLDRNDQNILVKIKKDPKTKKLVRKLVPIDHGMSIPESFEITSFEIVWMDWP